MLREADEVAHKVLETKQTVAVTTHPEDEDVKLPAANETDCESSGNIDADTEGFSSVLMNVGLNGLDRHKMRKKSNQRAARNARRVAARAAAVGQSAGADGVVGNDGTGRAMGEEGGPGVGWSAAETQGVGQVRVGGGLCSRINFRTATEYPPIHVLFSNKPSNASNAFSSPFGPALQLSRTSTFAAELASAAVEDSCGKPEALQ